MTVARDIHSEDLGAVLALNREWEHVTSPLSPQRLSELAREACLFRAIDGSQELSAFLLAFGPRANYDSVNYRWFDERFEEFLYIDRVVVSARSHRLGFGGALYSDAISFARSRGIPRLVCEIDVEPLNAVSVAFHDTWGFTEVGTQLVGDSKKRVSLRELTLL